MIILRKNYRIFDRVSRLGVACTSGELGVRQRTQRGENTCDANTARTR